MIHPTSGLAVLLVFLSASRLIGQDLMTRPIGFRSGLTEGAVTTRPGTLTVDAGGSVRQTAGTTTWRAGEFNVRMPLSARLEARLYANSYAWRRLPASGRERAAARPDTCMAA